MAESGPREWSPRTRHIAVRVIAASGHTRSGNPKRGWLIVDNEGFSVDFVDEGYEGKAVFKRAYPDAIETSPLEISNQQYRDFMKFAAEQYKKHRRGEI